MDLSHGITVSIVITICLLHGAKSCVDYEGYRTSHYNLLLTINSSLPIGIIVLQKRFAKKK